MLVKCSADYHLLIESTTSIGLDLFVKYLNYLTQTLIYSQVTDGQNIAIVILKKYGVSMKGETPKKVIR